jgi:hypothetical protein
MKTKNKVEVDYAVCDAASRRARQDASWYVDYDGHTWVATVTLGGDAVHVYCDGEMRIIVDGDYVVRTTDDLEMLDLYNDKQLFEANEAGRTWWENNAWFDLYDAESGQHLDCVCDSVRAAVDAATEVLKTQYTTEGDAA